MLRKRSPPIQLGQRQGFNNVLGLQNKKIVKVHVHMYVKTFL